MCSENMFPLLKKGASIAAANSDTREAMPYFKEALDTLGIHQYKALKHLMLHLLKISQGSKETGMSSKNLAIVWAPNLIRTPLTNIDQEQHIKIQHNLVQNTHIVQYLIDNAQWLFEDNKKESKTNQLPPQYLERVKFIQLEDQKAISLSKR